MKTKERKQENKISRDLAENIKQVKNVFQDCSDVIYREIQLTEDIRGLLVYIEGIAKVEDVQQHMLRPLIEGLAKHPHANGDIYPLSFTRISLSQTQAATDWPTVINGVLTANVAIFVEGMDEVLLFSVKGGSRRSVQEPQTEAVIRGPREGFTESLRINTALIRFKIKSEKLKLIDMVIGSMTKTDVAIAYIEGVAEESLIADVKDRLESIDIDGILESGYIEEWIEDNPSSPFPQMQYSERPDSVAAQLLEEDRHFCGRHAVCADCSCDVMAASAGQRGLLRTLFHQQYDSLDSHLFLVSCPVSAQLVYRGHDLPSGYAAFDFNLKHRCFPGSDSFPRVGGGLYYGNLL